MLGMESTAWLDARGRPLFELAMNGVMIAALEDEASARGYLAAAALSRNDAILEWSLVKAPLALPDARRAVYLRIVLPDAARAPLSDERQNCRREATDVVCEIDAARPAAPGSAEEALKPSAIVTSNDPKIRELARGLVSASANPRERVNALLAWLDANIAKEAVDAFSARDVLDAKRGECQGHAWLYAALARALGVPTRVVNGLVYAPEYGGFLYHTWAESLVDGDWRAVDPTFGQAQADATHIALGRGETMADLVPLVEWMGKTRIRVLEAR
jgi:transglutaminase-like putative cysteine protease